MKVAIAVVASIAVAVGVAIGGWQLGWWMRSETVNRTAEIREQSFARQAALQEEVLSLHREVTRVDVQIAGASEGQRGPLVAQRRALVNRLCDAHARMTGRVTIPVSVETFVQEECV